MHSIRTRITSLTTTAVLACALLIGALSVFTVKAKEEQSSEQLMTLICTAKCDVINNYLGSIEQSGETLSRYAYDSLDTVKLSKGNVIGATGSGRSLNNRERTSEQQAQLDAHLREHVAGVEEVFDTIGNNTSLLGYYYRINPEISQNVKGFWYVKQDTLNFERHETTNITAYAIDDYAHVGWYYQSIERGRPSWISPYENENLNTTIVSYVIPLYKAGTFIGVIGMDISYDTFVDKISDLAVLDTGYAFLIDEMGKIVYHPKLENDVLLSDISTKLEAAHYEEKSSELISYTFDGVKKKAAWGTLSNGLKLIVSAPASEINAGWRSLSWLISIISLVIMVVFLRLTATIVRRLTDPLEHLVQASEQISAGNYDVKLDYQGTDEVGTLTRAFQQMAEHLQYFINDLNLKANKDALTNVRNKHAFDVICHDLNDSIRTEDQDHKPDFAIGMFDCNDLKMINDTFGHEKGDLYLQNACRFICTVFAHSAVFRVGGDEFVAILQGDDLSNAEQMEERFDHEADVINSTVANAWERVNIARGVVRFDPATDTDVSEVVSRADKRMYAHKHSQKAKD